MNNKKTIQFIIVGIVIVTSIIGIIIWRGTYSLGIPDDKFDDIQFYNCVKEIVGQEGYDSDGIISETSLNEIVEIDCEDQGIESTKGLELMSQIVNLVLTNNKLTSIDVSHNPKLQIIDIGNNEQGQNKVKSIDVSQNQELKYDYG